MEVNIGENGPEFDRSAPVPSYGIIDEEIFDLVSAMNKWEGIWTIGSCAGHNPISGRLVPDYYEGNVLFLADSLSCLHAILSAFPNGGVNYPLGPNCCPSSWGRISGEFRQLSGWPEPVFSVNIGASPLSRQRELLNECAEILTKRLARRKSKTP